MFAIVRPFVGSEKRRHWGWEVLPRISVPFRFIGELPCSRSDAFSNDPFFSLLLLVHFGQLYFEFFYFENGTKDEQSNP